MKTQHQLLIQILSPSYLMMDAVSREQHPVEMPFLLNYKVSSSRFLHH
jgi:hypothetical protein